MNDSLQFYSTNVFFSTISETWFHFSTNSISLQFLKIVFTFSTIFETCFHLFTISETYFHLSTISISLRFWCDPKLLQFLMESSHNNFTLFFLESIPSKKLWKLCLPFGYCLSTLNLFHYFRQILVHLQWGLEHQ